MSKKRFTIYKEDKFKDEWYAYPFYIKDNGEKITETMPMGTAKEVANLLNSLADDIKHLEEYCGDLESDVKRFEEENKKLKAVLERKETLLKIRTENNEKIMKSIQQLIIYLENSVYKSDVSAITVKKDIISLIKKWEVR